MSLELVLLPGDGIGPEIMGEAERILLELGRAGLDIRYRSLPFGGDAIDRLGVPLPEETLRACQAADGVLMAAVGGPRWDALPVGQRPESGLLALRRALGVFANLRPVRVYPTLSSLSPLRPDVVAKGVDILFVRELTGGLYFGEPRYRQAVGPDEERAVDTLAYTTGEVVRVARVAFRAAAGRRGRLTSVDKANVLFSSQLWRDTVTRVAEEFPRVQLDHQLVDSMAMRLVAHPEAYDVVVTENMFGDILTDLAGGLTGSLGLLPSASLGEAGPGLYEPIHGSAPDIAGRGVANPIGLLLSLAMFLRYGAGAGELALALEGAVEDALNEGYATPDIAVPGSAGVSTQEMGEAVRRALRARLS